MIAPMAVKKQLLLALLATGASYVLAVSAIHSEAHAQDATKFCNSKGRSIRSTKRSMRSSAQWMLCRLRPTNR